MDYADVDVQPATAQPGLGKIPTHKITITDGPTKYVYWYTKLNAGCRDFDKMKHWELVKLLHAKGQAMSPGAFESFSVQGADYHLTSRGRSEFTIEALN